MNAFQPKPKMIKDAREFRNIQNRHMLRFGTENARENVDILFITVDSTKHNLIFGNDFQF